MRDVASPSFKIELIGRRNEVRIQGRGDPESGGQALLLKDQSERVTDLVFEDAEREHDVLKLTVDNRDLSFFDDPAWQKGNLLRVGFGYPGSYFGPRLFVVDNMVGFRTLQITLSQVGPPQSNVAREKLWKGTRLSIVQELVRDGAFPGVHYLVSQTPRETEVAREWTQARQTDWQFLKRLAEEVGYEAYVEGDTLHFHERALDRRPVRDWRWFTGRGELLDFDVTSYRWSGQAGKVKVLGWDDAEAVETKGTGSEEETKRTVLGPQSTVGLEVGADGGLLWGSKTITTPRVSASEAKTLADAHYRASTEAEVEARATIVGDPEIRAKNVVTITGIGNALSGNWYVKKITHKVAVGATYVCDLELIRNGLLQLPIQDKNVLVDKTVAAVNSAGADASRSVSFKRDAEGGVQASR